MRSGAEGVDARVAAGHRDRRVRARRAPRSATRSRCAGASPARGDPATAAEPDVTRRSRGPDASSIPALPACTTARIAPVTPRTESSAPVTSASTSSRGFTRTASRRAPCQVPKRKPSDAASPTTSTSPSRCDAVRAVHDEQLGDLRVADDLDGLVRGPHAHAARARGRRVEQPGGLGRIEPAGRDRLEDLAPAHAGHASPISATKASSRKSVERVTPGRAGPVVLRRRRRRAGRRRCRACRTRLRSRCCASAAGASPSITSVGVVLEQPFELVEPLHGARPARVLGPVHDALVVGGGPVRGHPGRLARSEPDRRVVARGGRRA